MTGGLSGESPNIAVRPICEVTGRERRVPSGYRGVVSHVATANEITAPRPPVERGAMHHSERLVHIRGLHPKRLPPGGLWAITGHPNRKDIEVWC